MNKKIKLYQLKNIKNCKFKAYISQFNDFKTMNNKSTMINQVYKTIIKDYNFTELTKEELNNIINELLDEKYFLTSQEKKVESNLILQNLTRYINYEKSLHRNILEKKVYGSVTIGENEIELGADLVVENTDNIEIIKFKTSATDLSYKARTAKNLPENSIDLYLLKKLGEQLYHSRNKPIISSFYHFKGKKDKGDEYTQFLSDKTKLIDTENYLSTLVFSDKKEQKANDKQIKLIKDILYFNHSQGNNIITFNYDESLDNAIEQLLDTKLNFDSNRCKSSDCDFCNYSTLCNYNKNENNNKEFELVKTDKKKKNDKVKFTDAQNELINLKLGNCRVNAVAGSGKSSTIVGRTINLLDKGYAPDEILLITFTNKGAVELKDKIRKQKNINPNNLHIYTFNSFGESIVSNEWEKLGFTQQPQLCKTVDVNDIIKEMLQMEEYNHAEWLNYKNLLLNYPNAKGAFKQLTIYFNIIKSYGYDVKTFNEKILLKEKAQYEGKAELIYKMYDTFNEMLKAKNLLQYQDQILYLIELLENYPHLIETYGYKHVMVDEYQDTDFTQVKLLHLLHNYSKFKSLVVTGDNSQAIYLWRNTTPENIINFHEEFNNVKDIYLLDNFRSTPEICYLANELDKLNTQRIEKEIVSRKEHGETPLLIQYDTLEDEYTDIIQLIKNNIINQVPKHEICVIARTKKELLAIQSKLDSENIPSIIECSELFIENTYVQGIINLGNFFKNNEYDYYLLEYLYLTNMISPENTEDEIKNIAVEFKAGIMEEFDDLQNEEEKIEYFYNMISLLTEKDKIAKIFVDDLKETTFHTFSHLLEYLYKIILYHDETSIEKDDNKYDVITLTTAHSSKGKEWSTIITTINSFKYESIQSDLTLLEEERRLLFVDITRAKNNLYITYNTSQDKSRGKGKYCLFADELKEILSN